MLSSRYIRTSSDDSISVRDIAFLLLVSFPYIVFFTLYTSGYFAPKPQVNPGIMDSILGFNKEGFTPDNILKIVIVGSGCLLAIGGTLFIVGCFGTFISSVTYDFSGAFQQVFENQTAVETGLKKSLEAGLSQVITHQEKCSKTLSELLIELLAKSAQAGDPSLPNIGDLGSVPAAADILTILGS